MAYDKTQMKIHPKIHNQRQRKKEKFTKDTKEDRRQQKENSPKKEKTSCTLTNH